MGFFYENSQPTDAMREYWKLKEEKSDLQKQLSLIQLREEVEELRDKVAGPPKGVAFGK